MAQEIILSGVGAMELRYRLRQSLIKGRPRVVGIASAFVSTSGVFQLIEILRKCGEPECRLIAGTDNAVTHPEALYAARDHGWKIRLGRALKGIYHPKLLVAGQKFSASGTIQELCCTYVGSSNLTMGGLEKNVECGLIANANGCLESASHVFAELWKNAAPASEAELRHYAARFAERSRLRSVSELADLGIGDMQPAPPGAIDLGEIKPTKRPALGTEFAVAAWAGLQSFTGEYRFQVEFPKGAGSVVNQLVRAYAEADGRIDVYCPDDETTRSMQYKFYLHNSMFRLNVPNDVPGVVWAREHKDGVAVVEKGPAGGAPLRIRLLKPGADASEVVGRSVLLGTWGRTTTRAYGWY